MNSRCSPPGLMKLPSDFGPVDEKNVLIHVKRIQQHDVPSHFGGHFREFFVLRVTHVDALCFQLETKGIIAQELEPYFWDTRSSPPVLNVPGQCDFFTGPPSCEHIGSCANRVRTDAFGHAKQQLRANQRIRTSICETFGKLERRLLQHNLDGAIVQGLHPRYEREGRHCRRRGRLPGSESRQEA